MYGIHQLLCSHYIPPPPSLFPHVLTISVWLLKFSNFFPHLLLLHHFFCPDIQNPLYPHHLSPHSHLNNFLFIVNLQHYETNSWRIEFSLFALYFCLLRVFLFNILHIHVSTSILILLHHWQFVHLFFMTLSISLQKLCSTMTTDDHPSNTVVDNDHG